MEYIRVHSFWNSTAILALFGAVKEYTLSNSVKICSFALKRDFAFLDTLSQYKVIALIPHTF